MSKKKMDFWQQLFFGAVIGLTISIAFTIIFNPYNSWKEETMTYSYSDIYYAEAPFGVLYADVEGSTSGGFMWQSGSIDTKLSESYVVKYWEDGMLKSKSLDAEDTPIIVDGTFRLNTTVITSQVYKKTRYTLHLPFLSENVTNYNWKGVD
ncbi:MAG: hypothetical protein PVH61_31665 [Candidatus Aminicenantes bacterium]|jgi:hypothetical protein